ncbi:hypothetical protein AWB81_05323 [Caballeronia arationis]|nr:hypothetical protein AWB81_05323 [Caballeronia arationis]
MNASVNATQQLPCNCTTCLGTGCTCGCQQATEQTAGGCGPQCQCGAGASCAQP